MNKAIGVVVLGALLSGCFSARMQPQEKVLGLKPDQGKVYILSAIPHDSSGIFLNTLIVQETNNDVLAYTFSQDSSGSLLSGYFADSIQAFDPTTFPVIVKSVYPDSVRMGFRFSLERDNISFTEPKLETAYAFTFPKQDPFSVNAPATDFRISTVEPFDATLESLNGKTINKPYTLALHVLDNSAPLFGQKNRQSFYWLDCRINDSLTHSLFLTTDSSGKTTILYTTFPPLKGVEITERLTTDDDLTIALQFINETILIQPIDEQNAPSGRNLSYWVGAVKLTQNSVPVGTGMLYKL